MIREYDVPAAPAMEEITEKKSRFIAHIARVSSEEEAADFIRKKKKEYWDARHNCSAFVIGPGHELTRCSDDGEPSGTAGRPMLDILLRSGLHDTAAVVTRYFGGVLLGTGGLVRAYSSVLQKAADTVPRLRVRYGRSAAIRVSYQDYGKIGNLLCRMGLEADGIDYGELVTLHLMVPEDVCSRFEKEITEGTNGKAQMEFADPQWYERQI